MAKNTFKQHAKRPFYLDGDHASVTAFVEFCMADDSYGFEYADAVEIATQTKTSINRVIAQLVDFGLTYTARPRTKEVRGFTANCNNRWEGNPCAGGSGGKALLSGFTGHQG